MAWAVMGRVQSLVACAETVVCLSDGHRAHTRYLAISSTRREAELLAKNVVGATVREVKVIDAATGERIDCVE